MTADGKTITEALSIPAGEGEHTSAILTLPQGEMKRTGVIVAHGAGNDMRTPLLEAFADGLAREGYPVMRFNFLYTERGRKAPDRYETLVQTWAAAARFFWKRTGKELVSWVAAGKSMGGRVASQMAADHLFSGDGLISPSRLVFLGYPLHPPGDKEKLRDEHLYRIEVPMLFFAGTRDPLCDLEKLHPVLDRLTAPWRLHIVEGGDHSFHVPKSLKRAEAEIQGEIVSEAVRWLGEEIR